MLIYTKIIYWLRMKTNLISRKMSSDDLDLHIEDSLKILTIGKAKRTSY